MRHYVKRLELIDGKTAMEQDKDGKMAADLNQVIGKRMNFSKVSGTI